MLRNTSERNLVISYITPHNVVKSTKKARWVIDVLTKAGIKTTTFTAHSTLSVATSKARTRGLSLTEVSKAAGWSNSRTFATFYDKPISNNFGLAVLGSDKLIKISGYIFDFM